MEGRTSMRRTRALIAAAISLLVVSSLAWVGSASADDRPATPQSSYRSAVHSIVGTWRMTIDPNGPTAPPSAFPSLVQFHADGTLTDSVSSAPVVPLWNKPPTQPQPNGATSGLGSWYRQGDTIYFSFERFLTIDGVFVARQHVDGKTTVSDDGMSQSGPASATFLDTHDNQIGLPVPIDASGQRLLP
jgi:hypothetical protein